MKALALGALFIAGYSEPSLVETINTDVNHDHAYSHYIRKVNEARVLKPGEAGNAPTSPSQKSKPWPKPVSTPLCLPATSRAGKGTHSLLLDDGRVLDNRFDDPVSYNDVGCM